MTPTVMLLNLGLSYVGLAALCLSMKRHHSAVLQRQPGPRRILAFRSAGWAALGLSFALAVHFEGWAFGPVQWIGGISASAILLVGVLSYRPNYVLPSTALAIPLTVLAVFAT